MHCLQCLPPAVAESSYTPSQFIMGVAIWKVMPRPLCPSPQKNYFAFVNLCHRCPHQKIIISSLNTLQQSLFYVTFIKFVKWFYEFFVSTNLRNCQDTEFVYLFLCTVNVNNNIHFRWKICTVKLGNKERFDKEQIGIKEPFPVTKLPFIPQG